MSSSQHCFYMSPRESGHRRPNQSAAANRRPAGQLDGLGNLAALVAADRAFPAAVAELDR
jgi:hypothetical protein